MSGVSLIAIVVAGVTGLALASAVYAAFYSLIGRFLVGEPVDRTRSFFATLAGLPIGVATAAIVASAVFYGQISRPIGAPLAFVCWFLTMTAMNMLIVRKRSGGQLSFIQAFMLQLPPNALLLAYSMLTRPAGY